MYRLDLRSTHQSCNAVFSSNHASFTQVTDGAWAAVDAHALVVELFDLSRDHFVGLAFINDLFDSLVFEFRGIFHSLYSHFSILILTSLFV